MTTLALYIAFLISDGRAWANLDEVLADFAKVEAFNAFVKKSVSPIDADAIAHLKAGNKIRAIKVVRQNLMDAGKDYGLKVSKDLVDTYIEANPGTYPRPVPPYTY